MLKLWEQEWSRKGSVERQRVFVNDEVNRFYTQVIGLKRI